MKNGIYVYGIVRSGALDTAPAVEGVDRDRRVSLVEAGDLSAIVGGVDVSQFEGPALEANANTPEWLEEKVRGHERVLDAVVGRCAVVPMRFGAMFSTEAGVRELLTRSAESIRSSLARIEGKTEWGVKVECDLRLLMDRLPETRHAEISGTNYLRRKAVELRGAGDAREAASQVASEIHARLVALADESSLLSHATGTSERAPVLNAAYLVDDRRRDDFMTAIQDLQGVHQEAYEFQVTGPWPPYNFTEIDVDGART
ncbi:MAG: GvpL/GvpF family gas vesicle protein [Actinomycetota bacterium]|nr:GvpL/GvpF family gas vesicle protein [Actinomycetota bacterium]